MNNRHVTLTANEKIGLISNLSTMLSAGIPILDAVDSSLVDTKGNAKKVLETLRSDLMQGKHVYVSFSAFPNAFDTVTVSLLKAAEEAGTLETTLNDLREHVQKEAEFVDKIRLALVYPVLISIVFLGVLLVILVVVIPKISLVFSRLRVELPLPTRILIGVSNLLLNHTAAFSISLLLTILTFVFLLKHNRRAVYNFLFSLPLISGLVRTIDLTRFTRTLHLLLSSGIPIDSALQLCHAVVLRKNTAAVIAKSREMVLAGKKLADGLRSDPKVVPGIMIKLVEAGEKSGSLEKSMKDISVHLDYQVENLLKTLTSVLEPVMLLVV